MRLKAFNKNKNYNKNIVSPKITFTLGIIVAGLIAITFYQSFALYKINITHNFVEGEVGSFSNADIKLAIFVDGNKTDTFPKKTGGKVFEKITCTNSETGEWDYINWKLVLGNLTKKTECDVYFTTGTTLAAAMSIYNTLQEGRPDFNNISSASDTGLWSYPEDNGTSHYFRGNKTTLNNNVLFAGLQWKIIRIDKGGNIRMIYNGTCPNNNCTINSTGILTQTGTSLYATGSTSTYYSKQLKTANDAWYTTNINNKGYDRYVATVTYCSDRSGARQPPSSSTTYYAAFDRLYCSTSASTCYGKAPIPVLGCLDTGSGTNNVKVGIITADELVLAGGKIGTNNTSFYLYNNLPYWTITGDHQSTQQLLGYVYAMNATGGIYVAMNRDHADSTLGIRPVIALNAGIQIIKGTGSTSDPFIVSTPHV